MTVGLTMMVKDEAANIERCLAAARPLVDRWTILDTGSTDDTPKLISRMMRGTPGELHRSPFVNFAASRTELMNLARGTADYLMLLDADMTVRYPADRLPPLTADVYEGTILQGTLAYALPILVRGDRAWRYEGVAHSYLAADKGWDGEVLPGLEILDGSSTSDAKLRLDLELLAAEHARNPLDARTCFYLAQTYADLDMFPEAIEKYRARIHLDGWAEETYYARYQLGSLLCQHVSYAEGASHLLAAWEMRPNRTESLRVLANVTTNVADKTPYPTDLLFVKPSAYATGRPAAPAPAGPPPPLPPIAPTRARRKPKVAAGKLRAQDVSAVVVTRGNVDLAPILATIPYDDVVVWDNAEREHDYKAFGRYAAIPETKNPVIFWVDDDVLFTNHDALLAEYEPGKLVANMDEPWIDGAGYRDLVAMQGAGSLCPADLPARVFERYLAVHPWDVDALVEADFIFGVLAPFKIIDVGYDTMPYTDDPDRLYTQPGQTERKWRMIERCRAMLPAPA
jgi:hypothetical protein